MKKIITIIVSFILLLCVFGCSKVKTSIFNASYFLDDSANHSIAYVNETNSYTVSYEQAETETNIVITVDSQKSTYTTVLTNTTYNGTNCYLLETALNIQGEIDNQGSKTVLNDVILTKCYFLGVDNSLRPLYSERSVKSNVIKRTSSITSETHTYVVNYYDYEIKTEYQDNSATVSLTVNEKPTDDTEFNSYSNHKFEEIAGKTAYIDNEILLFAPRAMTLTTGTAKSFYTIDAVSMKNHEMNLASISGEPTKTIKPDYYSNNGTKIPEVLCYGVMFSINSNASGSPIIAYYADTNNKSERARMIQAQSVASYEIGTYTYTIMQSKNV